MFERLLQVQHNIQRYTTATKARLQVVPVFSISNRFISISSWSKTSSSVKILSRLIIMLASLSMHNCKSMRVNEVFLLSSISIKTIEKDSNLSNVMFATCILRQGLRNSFLTSLSILAQAYALIYVSNLGSCFMILQTPQKY